jgi:ArsR family transcriptional regulator, arsenate/arsenite/antimonite-responsive transcriptional repressor
MEKELLKILKALADENRIRILGAVRDKKTCVCVIESALKMTQSNVSRHLTKLKDAGLITGEKKGQFAYYGINREILKKYAFLAELIREIKPSSAGPKNGKC